MANNKKYQALVSQQGDAWRAQIVRQVTSKKTTVSKQQDGFASEQEASDWAAAELAQFTDTQASSNQRHGVQRKKMEALRSHRAIERAEKKAVAAAEKKEEDEDKDEQEARAALDKDDTAA